MGTEFHPLTVEETGGYFGEEEAAALRALCCDDQNCGDVDDKCSSSACSSNCDGFVNCDGQTPCVDPNCNEPDCYDASPCFEDSCVTPPSESSPPFADSAYDTTRGPEIVEQNINIQVFGAAWAQGPVKGEENFYQGLINDPACSAILRAVGHQDGGDSVYCCWNGCETGMQNQAQLQRHFDGVHYPSAGIQHHFHNCGGTIDPPSLDHHFQQESDDAEFVCCWPGCEKKFPLVEDLDRHLKIDHLPRDQYPLECKWNLSHGRYCGHRAKDMNDLHEHVQRDHFTSSALSPEDRHPCLPPLKAEDPIVPIFEKPNERHAIGLPTPEDSIILDASPQGRPAGDNLEETDPLVCMWLVQSANGLSAQRCNWKGENASDLQEHIEECHLQALKKPAECVCLWEGCHRCAGKPFSQKAKLERHIKSHTGGKCLYFQAVVNTLTCKQTGGFLAKRKIVIKALPLQLGSYNIPVRTAARSLLIVTYVGKHSVRAPV
jgi:hypothetical protein